MKKIFSLIILILLVTTNAVISSENIVEDKFSNTNILESVNVSKKPSSQGKIAYGFSAYCPGFPEGTICFDLDDPGNITLLAYSMGGDFFSGGTWTNDWRWLTCNYGNGHLCDVNPCHGGWAHLGGGGTSLNGLAYNPVTEKLYGASCDALYEIDIETGEQQYIGDFGISSTIICIEFDSDGVLYAWDVKYEGDSYLYTIDIETGKATKIGSMGLTLTYAQDGAFDYETDTLYLSAYIFNPNPGGYLIECDEDTGNCTIIGPFQEYGEITALAIPYGEDAYPPKTRIFYTPKNPDGDNGWYISDVKITLGADDNSCVNATYYRINYGEWKIIPGGWDDFIISEEGDDILIEYYSIDELGNTEDIKSKTIDIDKTPPEISLKKKLYMENGTWYEKIILRSKDEVSGIDRLNFYINGVLQETIDNPLPEIVFTFKLSLIKNLVLKFEFFNGAGISSYELLKRPVTISYSQLKSNNNQLIKELLQNLYNKYPLLNLILQRFLILICIKDLYTM